MTSGPPRIEVVARKWKYAAPPWRVYQALVDERDAWLHVWDDERLPSVKEAAANERVVLAPWVHPDIEDVEVVIGTDAGGYGAQLIVLMHAEHDLTTDRRKEVRYRLGTLFGEALRNWVDGY